MAKEKSKTRDYPKVQALWRGGAVTSRHPRIKFEDEGMWRGGEEGSGGTQSVSSVDD